MTDKSIAEPESLFLHSCWNATNHLPGHLLFHHSLHCTASINNVGLNLARHAIEMQFNVILRLIQIRITPLVIVLIEHVEEGFILNLIVWICIQQQENEASSGGVGGSKGCPLAVIAMARRDECKRRPRHETTGNGQPPLNDRDTLSQSPFVVGSHLRFGRKSGIFRRGTSVEGASIDHDEKKKRKKKTRPRSMPLSWGRKATTSTTTTKKIEIKNNMKRQTVGNWKHLWREICLFVFFVFFFPRSFPLTPFTCFLLFVWIHWRERFGSI